MTYTSKYTPEELAYYNHCKQLQQERAKKLELSTAPMAIEKRLTKARRKALREEKKVAKLVKQDQINKKLEYWKATSACYRRYIDGG